MLSTLFPTLSSSISIPPSVSNYTASLALTQYTRSASQRNIDALVKVGDYYFHGLGMAEEKDEVRWERAAAYYQAAADTHLSAQAEWNLGWMYENGIGVPRVSAPLQTLVSVGSFWIYLPELGLPFGEEAL